MWLFRTVIIIFASVIKNLGVIEGGEEKKDIQLVIVIIIRIITINVIIVIIIIIGIIITFIIVIIIIANILVIKPWCHRRWR